jgi:acetylornithine deacetylase/succinyl-diaminopimelate desuccinylase-like protein
MHKIDEHAALDDINRLATVYDEVLKRVFSG